MRIPLILAFLLVIAMPSALGFLAADSVAITEMMPPPPSVCCTSGDSLNGLNLSQIQAILELVEENGPSSACCALVSQPELCYACFEERVALEQSYAARSKLPSEGYVAPREYPWYESFAPHMFFAFLIIATALILLLVANGIAAAVRGTGFLSRNAAVAIMVLIATAILVLVLLFSLL